MVLNMIMFKSVGVLLAVSTMAALIQSENYLDDYLYSSGKPSRLRLGACIIRVAIRLARFDLGGPLMELVEASRQHYPFWITDVIRKQPHARYKEAMRRLGYRDGCGQITNRFQEITRDPSCQHHYLLDNVTFLFEVANYSEQAAISIEAYYACDSFLPRVQE